ncbi:uncharacterized protein LOC141646417 [Silene latifolia]|uniref:uncharacterized protein LOC141646417 n=1 Tax=Silene latifolia TaxID=37657 RepID=UPI003D76A9D0
MEDENCSFLALLMAPDESPVENPYEIQTPLTEFEPDYISLNQTPPQAENYLFSPLLPVPVQVSEFNNLNPVYEFDNFSVLPSLLSLETHFPESSPPPPPFKIPKLESFQPSSPPPPPPPPPQFDDYSLGSILNECTKKSIKNERRTTTAAAAAGKTRRVRIRDSMYELSKLMPAGYGRKKTMAEMLEVACKYVKFLQAQVNALECMPEVSRLADGGGGGGRLRRLTRQQLLQVAVNSEEMQVVMADNGLCLVSEEQIVQFKRVEMRSKIVQQLLAHIPI